MCGIAGVFDPAGLPATGSVTARLEAMSSRLRHRGPDDSGIWVDATAGIGLAHRRLSILDLSNSGHQPMFSASRRFVISYNGEIYNLDELRRLLGPRQPHWRGHSDTEVMLACVERWGLPGALQRFVGMFAFALWDRHTRELVLVRDRVGIKPLYWGRSAGTWLFASEPAAFRAWPGFDTTVSRQSLAMLLRYSCIPAPFSIYQGISKLLPGHYVKLAATGPGGGVAPEPVCWWSAREVAADGLQSPYAGSDEEALAELESLLTVAVGQRMAADVPLGAFLSGGIDSSTVVALMQKQSTRPVRTFTMGFQVSGYNEADQAARVARRLGSEHTELCVTSEQARQVIPSMAQVYDEPFSDSSQIPTFLVSRLAAAEVTVALSGDGGDELFCGYQRYLWAPRIWQRTGRLPAPVRRVAGRMLRTLPPSTWNALVGPLMRLAPKSSRLTRVGDQVHKLAQVMVARDPDHLYRLITSHWHDTASLVRGGVDEGGVWQPEMPPGLSDPAARMMYQDLLGYLPDDILTKVDRASMAVGLEVRVPLLDHRVVEYAWRLPMRLKVRDGVGKWPLRQLLAGHLPPALLEHPKMGFGVPLDDWLRGPLKVWAEALLDPVRLDRQGLLYSEPVSRCWREHLSGRRNWAYHLWDVLMLQSWLESHEC